MKTIFTTAILLLFSITVFSQSFGLIGGLTNLSIDKERIYHGDIDGYFDFDSLLISDQINYSIGGYYSKKIFNKLNLNTELIFSKQNFKINRTFQDWYDLLLFDYKKYNYQIDSNNLDLNIAIEKKIYFFELEIGINYDIPIIVSSELTKSIRIHGSEITQIEGPDWYLKNLIKDRFNLLFSLSKKIGDKTSLKARLTKGLDVFQSAYRVSYKKDIYSLLIEYKL